jgi:hypothetical protein
LGKEAHELAEGVAVEAGCGRIKTLEDSKVNELAPDDIIDRGQGGDPQLVQAAQKSVQGRDWAQTQSPQGRRAEQRGERGQMGIRGRRGKAHNSWGGEEVHQLLGEQVCPRERGEAAQPEVRLG